jgi:chromosome segregation ATPase
VDVIERLKAEVNALKAENKGLRYSVDYNRRQVSELSKQLSTISEKLYSTQNEEEKIQVNITKAKDILVTHKQIIVLLQEQLKTQHAMVEAAKTNTTRLRSKESKLVQKIKHKVDLKDKLHANIRVLRDNIISCNIELAELSKNHVDTKNQKETPLAISPEQIPVVQEVEKTSEEKLSKTPEQHTTAQDDIMFECINDWFSDSGYKTPSPIPAPVPVHTTAPTISQPKSCVHVPVHIFDSGDDETNVQANSKFRECKKTYTYC